MAFLDARERLLDYYFIATDASIDRTVSSTTIITVDAAGKPH